MNRISKSTDTSICPQKENFEYARSKWQGVPLPRTWDHASVENVGLVRGSSPMAYVLLCGAGLDVASQVRTTPDRHADEKSFRDGTNARTVSRERHG